MRTKAPAVLPLFRSELQARLLALLLLQPERTWTLQQATDVLGAPQSSVHRELRRAEDAGIIESDSSARPHRFRAARESPFYEPLSTLLSRSIGVETQLREALSRPGVKAASIYGSWAGGSRRPNSDVDVVVIGEDDLRDLRRAVRPIGKAAGRTIDLTLLAPDEFQRLRRDRSSFVRRLLEGPTTPLIGDVSTLV